MRIFTEAQLSKLKNELGSYDEVQHNIDDYEIKQREIEVELVKQAEEMVEENDLIFWEDMGAPGFDEGSSKVIEVENVGKLMYVGIEFNKVNVTDEEYEKIRECIKIIAGNKNTFEIVKAKSKIEEYSDRAVDVIFREARQFDFSHPDTRKNVSQLMGNLCLRYLKGRNLVLAILKAGKVTAHINLAILTAGQIRDRNAIKYLIEKMHESEYFENCLEALIKIRPTDKETIKEIMDAISSLDDKQKDLIDVCMNYANQFKCFGTNAAEVIFQAYNSCSRPGIRPIFTRAMQSLEDDSVWLLKNQLMQAKDDGEFFNVCQTLGRMKNLEAVQILIEAYKKYPQYGLQIVKGLSLSGNDAVLPLIISILEKESNPSILSECIRALAFIGDDSVLTYVEPFMMMRDQRYYVDALFVKARRGNKKALDELTDNVVNGNSNRQYSMERIIQLLKHDQITYIAKKTLHLPVSEAVLIVSALARVRVLPKQIGEVMMELLNKQSIPLKVEVYRLVGKYVNTRNEILPQEVLYEAIEKTDNIRLKREIENILKTIPQKISTIKVS